LNSIFPEVEERRVAVRKLSLEEFIDRAATGLATLGRIAAHLVAVLREKAPLFTNVIVVKRSLLETQLLLF